MTKYYLSLCCIIKDEIYLEEFIIYHKVIGFEHFYIYDNESNKPINIRLNNSYFKNMCTIIPFNGKYQQMNAYHHCLKKYGNETKWLTFIDCDEYICPKKDFSLRDFLNQFENYQAIGINWKMFGSNFHNNIQKGYLIDKYRMCEEKQNDHIKTIFQPQYIIKVKDPHHLKIKDPSKYVDAKKNIISGPFNKNHTIDIIQINHYHLKSLEEQIIKKQRGFADCHRHIDIPHESIYHNMSNEIEDNYICDKYLHHVKRFFEENNIKCDYNI